MLVNNDTLYQSSVLSPFREIIHGFSGRKNRDCRKKSNLIRILNTLDIKYSHFVMAEQIHGDMISDISGKDGGSEIKNADGLIFQAKPGDAGPVALGVKTADCVPILLYDPETRQIMAVHAGWRGTLKRIMKKAIGLMAANGTDPENIYAAIGPHIGDCCYTISAVRSEKFRQEFGDNPKIVYKLASCWHLNLGYINRTELENAGLKPFHIDDFSLCTACLKDDFFSYRSDLRNNHGEQISIIGFK
jgi:polyphenol oxidase